MDNKYLNLTGLSRLWGKIKALFVAKELKTGSTTEYKVLSDNNLTDELVGKINAIPKKTSEIENDSGFITKEVNDLTNYTKTADLHTVATSGKYEDLEGTPDLTVFTKDADLHKVAKSGKYEDLEGTPDLTGFITKDVDNLTHYTKTEGLSKVALSNNYLDLDNLPTIPADNKDLLNGAGYQTADDVTTAIGNALKDVTSISYAVVTELPATGEAGVIYLMGNGGENPNIYDEYIYVNDKFEKIGTTEVDLSGYVKFTDVITDDEIDAIAVL